MLRVHLVGIPGSNAEKLCVEERRSFEHATRTHKPFLHRSAETRNSVPLVDQQLPKRIQVRSARKSSCHADDRDALHQ